MNNRRLATTAFTSAGRTGIAPTSPLKPSSLGMYPLEKYPEIAAMPGFPEVGPSYRLVIIPLKPPTKTKGGIILTDEDVFANEVLCDIGYVARVGGSAYTDPRFVGSGPWCKLGDWVNYGRLSGKDTIFRGTDGEDHRIHFCNDRDIIALLPDPAAIKVYS